MTYIKKILFITFSAFIIAGCNSSDDETPIIEPVVDITSVVDVAASNSDFSTLVSLLRSTGLDDTLDASGTFTVFAPTNAAFDALGQETLDALANDPDTLSDILLYHVLTSQVDSSGAIAAAGSAVTTANGDPVAITAGGTGVGVRVNLSNITAVDILADNGVIHVIDKVMLPPESKNYPDNSILTIAKNEGIFTTLVSVLESTGLDSVLADLSSGAKYTVFAPTDDAFAAVDPDTLAALVGDTGVLSEVLLQHVVADLEVDSVTAMTLAGTDVATVSGNLVGIEIMDGELKVGGATVIFTNINTANGVIHVIDQVIVGDVEIPMPEPVDPPSGGGADLAINGDFEDGLNGWVASPAVTIATEDGNSYASAEVTAAGNAFDVNISQILTLEAGAEYILSFRARATQARTIIAGIGFNFAPWYANVEEVALTTDWQEFTLTLAAIDDGTGEDLGGENNRIIFDLGAAVGNVHIDDVEFRQVGGEQGLGEEQAVNAGFNDGLNGWVYTDGAVTIASEDGDNYASAEVTEAGTPFSVNISQVVSLEPGATYVLSFDARATQARPIIAGIGLNYAPWYANIEEVALTTNWNTFELTLDAIDDGTGAAFGDANNRIIFDLGAAVGTVHIDNVSLRKVLTGSEGGNVSTPGLDGYTLVWSDEFDAAELDNAAWTPLLGDGSDFGIPGWGNNELQNYTAEPENVSLGVDEDNTVLKITALEDGSGGYTSARLTTAGKVSVRYGKIVGRMKLPETQGFWPAFWLLGDANEVFWPGVGEIDIMELIGHEPDKTHHTVHFVNENQQYNFIGQDFVNSEKFSEGYNDFMIDWTPEYITWYVNDEQAFQLPIRDYMKEFQRPFHIILNVAVGGNWPGSPDDTSVFPQTMYVDYVRVYEKDGFIPDAPPPVDACEETIGCSGSAGSADISQAILTGFDDFGPDLGLLRFGAGGEPSYSNSDDAIDGAQSVQFSYPGGAFGGSWITLTQPRDLSAYAASDLVFAIKKPAVVANLEVKLESNGGGAGSMFLVDYSSTDLGNGWEEYRIPLADFVAAGLVLEELTIPFALWNPVDTNGDFPAADILFDAIRFE